MFYLEVGDGDNAADALGEAGGVDFGAVGFHGRFQGFLASMESQDSASLRRTALAVAVWENLSVI